MMAVFEIGGQSVRVDMSRPNSLAMTLENGGKGVNCFWAPDFEAEPVRFGDFVGSTALGGIVNFMNLRLNPHGNGTHTECVGHIAKEPYTIFECLKDYTHLALLVSVYPEKTDEGDRVIFKHQLEALWETYNGVSPTALVVRSLPNDDLKLSTRYSGANPPYFHHEATAWMADMGVAHLLTDFPSVDREEDGGQLLAHKAFWHYPGENVRTHATITELMYAPAEVRDGFYILQHQIAPMGIDASPSNPVLYEL